VICCPRSRVRRLAALSSQPPKPSGARGWRRKRVPSDDDCAINASRRNAPKRMAFSVNSGVNDLATPRQPERPEVVTYVLGTFRYYVSGPDTFLTNTVP
jgi:hypothetical protein